MAAQTMAVNPEPIWRLYSALASAAGVTPKVTVADPRVVVGELAREDGRRFVWFINLVDAALRCRPRLRARKEPLAVRVLELEASPGRAARGR